MHDYDTVLKLLLRNSAGCMLRQVTNASIRGWLDVELPTAQQLRVDLLGQTDSGGMEHIELQSQNHAEMPMRMLEYRVGIYRQYGVFPRQTVLYVGKEKLRMQNGFEVDGLSFQYNLVNASELDGEALLASDEIGDNVLAILAHVASQSNAIRRIAGRIARLEPLERQDRIGQLLILSGLRALGREVQEEVNRMPITENILDHELIAPAYRRGIQKGLEEGELKGLKDGIEVGMARGRIQGERAIVQRLLEKRFGSIPASAALHLDQCSAEALEEIGLRLLDARSLEELLP